MHLSLKKVVMTLSLTAIGTWSFCQGVGIGIAMPEPGYKLHVVGNTLFNGSLLISDLPGGRLDIAHSVPRTGEHPNDRPLYVTGSLGAGSNGIEFRHANGTQGIGFGYNTIYATGSAQDQNIGLAARGALGSVLLSTMGLERMRINGDGMVGIGTTAPSKSLHIYNGNDPAILLQSDGIDELSGKLSLRQVNLTGIDMYYDGVQTVDALVFETFYIGASNGRKMTIDLDGNVGIGITENIASGHKLSVNGKIACTEVRVQPQSEWPDYVFATDYKLMPLDVLRSAIENKKHLPGIPSADEIHRDGLLMGDMQIRMMEKIEELTLYILQLHDEIKILKQQAASQRIEE